MLLLAGCSSDGGDQQAAPSPTARPTGAADDQTELPTLGFAQGPDQPTQVAYELDTAEGSEQLTVAWEGDRFALIRGDGSIIRRGSDDVVFCTDSPEGTLCWNLEDRGEAFLQRVAADLLAIYGLAGLMPESVEELEPRTVAGREARCVAFDTGGAGGTEQDGPAAGTETETSSPADGETATEPTISGTTYCYDEATQVGLLLEVETGGVTQTLEATSFGEPDAGVFEPPAEVMPYPSEGVPGQPGVPTAPSTPGPTP